MTRSPLQLATHRLRSVLCIGAHADDIEIGCAGTVMSLINAQRSLTVDWVVLSAEGARAQEARDSALRVLGGLDRVRIETFRQRFFPAVFTDLKQYFDQLGRELSPEVVFCPRLEDAHQDHRLIAELAWQTFRSQTILEYEIAKYEGDLGRPNVYVGLSADVVDAKLSLLQDVFLTQHARDWFDDETFRGLLRIRGVECRAPSGYAEAFTGRKLVLG